MTEKTYKKIYKIANFLAWFFVPLSPFLYEYGGGGRFSSLFNDTDKKIQTRRKNMYLWCEILSAFLTGIILSFFYEESEIYLFFIFFMAILIPCVLHKIFDRLEYHLWQFD